MYALCDSKWILEDFDKDYDEMLITPKPAKRSLKDIFKKKKAKPLSNDQNNTKGDN